MTLLTAKQERFVAEYLIHLNATRAAINAGYSAKTAKEQGCRLLTKVHIQAVVTMSNDRRAENTKISQEWVLRQLKAIADRCMSENEFNPQGALRALELLGKHLQLFKPNVVHAGKMHEELLDELN